MFLFIRIPSYSSFVQLYDKFIDVVRLRANFYDGARTEAIMSRDALLLVFPKISATAQLHSDEFMSRIISVISNYDVWAQLAQT